ncbi:MAG: T9SS type A sorting domain-containing protein [bacterium]|nr:T9SS type A sorting domain-containing protein [bacterium]
MKSLLVILFPLALAAQVVPHTDKPCGPLCSRGNAVHGQFASLDAESLHSYDQLELWLSLSIQNGDLPLTGVATIELVTRENMSAILFNAEQLAITQVLVNDIGTPYVHGDDTLRVTYNAVAQETLTVTVHYSALPQDSWFETGFQTGWEQVYTFSEPFGARRWYPCWDQPSDKFAHVNIAVEMPENWTLAANGRLVNTVTPAPGRVRHSYEHTEPISTYLVHFAAGNFSNEVFDQDGVQYRYFAWPRSDSAQAAYDWERTPEMVDYFSTLFGDYPFDAYGMVMTDIFGGWGAMEHQTFTTYGFNLVDSLRTFEGIVAHELAHQWFGDHLSPVDFRNMWLNESFATYGDALWSEHLGGAAGLEAYMAQAALNCISEEVNYPPSYPIYDPPIERIFGTNVYYKGAWVLHMLRKQILGDSLFFAVLQDWVDTYGGGNVSTDEFIELAHEHWNGDDFHWFFDQWLYGLGMPTLTVDISPRQDLNRIDVHVMHDESQTPTNFEFPLIIEYGVNSYSERDTTWIFPTPEHSYSIPEYAPLARLADHQITLFREIPSSAGDPPQLPHKFTLNPAYPNPFNPSVTIPFAVTRPAMVRLELFDVTGRRAATIFEQRIEAGDHSIAYNAPPTLAAGIYLLRATSGPTTQTQKLLLLK